MENLAPLCGVICGVLLMVLAIASIAHTKAQHRGGKS